MDGTSVSAAMEYKKKKRFKLAGINQSSLTQGIMAVTSYANTDPLVMPKKPQSELEKVKIHAKSLMSNVIIATSRGSTPIAN